MSMVSKRFNVTLPVAKAWETSPASGAGPELWLTIEASGPERDLDGDRMSEECLEKMVEYVAQGFEGARVPYLDGHYRDLLAAMLGELYRPRLTEEKHFAVDVLLDKENPQALRLYRDIQNGKKHGASIAGIVHEAEFDEVANGFVFNDIEIMEVSRTTWPSWTGSFTEMLRRKMEDLTEQEEQAWLTKRRALADALGVRKVLSPHGWDDKFAVSNKPWSEVTDRSKRCQYAIVKLNDDGTFSVSKSGYPHHMPDCKTINAGGCAAAAGRLYQALKSRNGAWDEEFELLEEAAKGYEVDEDWVEEAARFTTAELKYAARHIIKHYRQDMEKDPPENLVDVSRAVSELRAMHAELKQVLEGIMAKTAENAALDSENVTTDDNGAEEIEVTLSTEDEVLAEDTGLSEDSLVEESGEEVSEAPEEENVDEEEVDEVELSSAVDARLAVHRFGTLFVTTHDMIVETMFSDAAPEERVAKAEQILDEFRVLVGKALKPMITAGLSPDDFVDALTERVEMKTGRLSVRRVAVLRKAATELARQIGMLVEMVEKADVLDDALLKEAVSGLEARVDERMSELQKRIDETATAHKESVQQAEDLEAVLDAVLQDDGPATTVKQAATAQTAADVVNLSPADKYEMAKEGLLRSLRH